MITKRLFVGIWILSIIGSLSVLPYAYFAGLFPESIPYGFFIFKSIVNSAIIYGIICWLSYVLIKRVDLKPFNTNTLVNIIYSGILPGICVGLIIVIFNKIFFQNSGLAVAQHPPIWAGLLASIYGAINEEVFCRLFLLTLIYYVLGKIIKDYRIYRSYLIWISIFLVSLIFGVGHLPAAFKMTVPSSLDIFRILFLNGIAGIIFGWLYCTKGFWQAVTAHFVADLMIHVFLIF